jgi:hypothetical protein
MANLLKQIYAYLIDSSLPSLYAPTEKIKMVEGGEGILKVVGLRPYVHVGVWGRGDESRGGGA